MARTKKEQENRLVAPSLSAVEFAGLLAWLDFELAMARKALVIWRAAAKKSSDPSTEGSVKYYESAERAIFSARQHAQQTLEVREAQEKLPKPVLTTSAFLTRVGRT